MSRSDGELTTSDFEFLFLNRAEADVVIQVAESKRYTSGGVRRRLDQLRFLLSLNALDLSECRSLVINFPDFLFWDISIVYEDDGIIVLNKPFDVRVDIPIKQGKALRNWTTEFTIADFFKQRYPNAPKVWLCHQLGKLSICFTGVEG